MQNGLYRIYFDTKRGPSAGVAVIADGRLRGGDGVLFFDGTISSVGNVVRADIEAGRHTRTDPPSSTILDRDEAHMLLEGPDERTQAVILGPITEDPALTFRMILYKLRD